MSSTERADALERLAGLLDGGDAVLGALGALGDDGRRPSRVSPWISPIRPAISAGGVLRALGELADLLGDDREAAALLAGAGGLDGGVEREQVGLLGDAGDRVDDAADPLRAGGELLDGGRDLREDVGHLAHRLRRPARRRRRPRSATVRASLGRLGGLPARSRPTRRRHGRPRRRSSRADSTMRTWRSAPCATSVTAAAISSIARAGLARTWTPSAATRRPRCRRRRRPRRSVRRRRPRIAL